VLLLTRIQHGVRVLSLAASLTGAPGWLRAQHQMAEMSVPTASGIPDARRGSGTSWLPDSSPVRALTIMRGAWMLSLQGAAFGFYDAQGTKRGAHQWGVTDWEMLMAMRPVGGGMLRLHAMTSVEPFILGGSGYSELLQTGGTYRHSVLFDRQHPHDALTELAASYERAVGDGPTLSLYVGAVGEPAVGPVSFMHRPSAENDPFAPIGHHWQDAAHQSFGVITVGVNTSTLRLEGSVFNPREPDEHHLIVDYRDAKLDSYAGRLSWAPTARVVASAWWAFLNSHDRLEPDTRMHRWGTSVLTESRGPAGGRLSSSLVWGVNLHHHGAASHELIHGGPGASPHHLSSSLLAESNLEIGGRSAVFARLERVEKNGEELGFQGGDLTTLYDVRAITLGAIHRVASAARLDASLGARASLNFVPASLLATYGTRTPTGVAVYLQLRPSVSLHTH